MAHNTRVIIVNDLGEARRVLKEVKVDSAGVEIMSSKAIHRVVKLEGVEGRAANILKQEMLARGGEAAVAKNAYNLRGDTTDVVLMGTLRQFALLLTKLTQQPLGLKEVADGIGNALSHFESTLSPLKWRNFELDLSSRTHLMGILNVTPDSFSDGGRFLDVAKAVGHGQRVEEEGADLIDIGGESTRPGAEAVSMNEELKRVIPVIDGLSKKISIPISIDTYKAKVAREALDHGASMVNDISGLRGDKEMASLVAGAEVPLVITHMKGTPRNMQKNPRYTSVLGEITHFLRQQSEVALAAGVARDKIIVDPGIGFGKTREHNLEILNRLPELRSLGFPILIGTSRKSFIGLTLDLPVEKRLQGTAATVAYSIIQGASVVRVHDVKEMVQVARMTDAIIRMK